MTLRVRRGSRRSGCPLLQDEQNQVVAVMFSAEGAATAQARAESIAASVNYLSTYGESLATLLQYVNEDEAQPVWARLAAAACGAGLLGALHAGAGAEAEIESRGDRKAVGR